MLNQSSLECFGLSKLIVITWYSFHRNFHVKYQSKKIFDILQSSVLFTILFKRRFLKVKTRLRFIFTFANVRETLQSDSISILREFILIKRDFQLQCRRKCVLNLKLEMIYDSTSSSSSSYVFLNKSHLEFS